MKTKERRPLRQEQGAAQSSRTARHTTTTVTARHGARLGREFAYNLLALPFALAFVVVACVLLTLVWPS